MSLGIAPPTEPTAFANATVAEVAQALEDLARTGNGRPHDEPRRVPTRCRSLDPIVHSGSCGPSLAAASQGGRRWALARDRSARTPIGGETAAGTLWRSGLAEAS